MIKNPFTRPVIVAAKIWVLHKDDSNTQAIKANLKATQINFLDYFFRDRKNKYFCNLEPILFSAFSERKMIDNGRYDFNQSYELSISRASGGFLYPDYTGDKSVLLYVSNNIVDGNVKGLDKFKIAYRLKDTEEVFTLIMDSGLIALPPNTHYTISVEKAEGEYSYMIKGSIIRLRL